MAIFNSFLYVYQAGYELESLVPDVSQLPALNFRWAGTSALACGIWWLPSMDLRLHSPSRPGALLHRESVETLLCDSQHAQLVRATAFERRRCFAFCFLALIILDICSLHVFANGGNMWKSCYVCNLCCFKNIKAMCGKLGHIIFTWGKCGEKKDEKHPLSTSVHKPSSALYYRVVPFPEGIRRIRQTASNSVKLKRHVQDSRCQ